MHSPFYDTIILNLQKIMRDRGLTQARMAEFAGTSPSQFNKILNRSVSLSIVQLSNIATSLGLSELDIITWPEHYSKTGPPEDEPATVLLQLKLTQEKKDQVLKLIFGDEDIGLI